MMRARQRVGRHHDEPAAGEPVVLDLRRERRRPVANRPEEGVGRHVEDAVGSAGRAREAADAAVGGEDELRRPGRTARVGRQRPQLAEVGGGIRLQERHGLRRFERLLRDRGIGRRRHGRRDGSWGAPAPRRNSQLLQLQRILRHQLQGREHRRRSARLLAPPGRGGRPVRARRCDGDGDNRQHRQAAGRSPVPSVWTRIGHEICSLQATPRGWRWPALQRLYRLEPGVEPGSFLKKTTG